jgi:hypothetical protein
MLGVIPRLPIALDHTAWRIEESFRAGAASRVVTQSTLGAGLRRLSVALRKAPRCARHELC